MGNLLTKQGFSMKWLVIAIIALFLIAATSFIIGRKTTSNSMGEIANTFKSIGKTQSPYEKCMYQCMEGHTELISYCRPHMEDFIANYNKYYDPFSVSRAFEETYIDKANLISEKNGIMLGCFRFVVGCRENLCKDYL